MKSRKVLITGATGALGGEVVRVLCDEGFDVVALFHRNEEAARRLQTATGCVIGRCDVTDEREVETIFVEAAPLFGVVHLAGVARDALLLRQTPGDWNETLSVNADGAFLVTRAALRHLQDDGHCILFASRAGSTGSAGGAAYAASKAAVIALMQCAAREGGARGLTFNAICPGFVPSAMNQDLSENFREEQRRQSVLGEFGTPVSSASAVCWLLSDAAREVSGQVISCHSRI